MSDSPLTSNFDMPDSYMQKHEYGALDETQVSECYYASRYMRQLHRDTEGSHDARG
ncbi:MAG: hypothetical protein HUJ51_00760 [Eggerthellaceae bacterium]|nr:hypothetical protein [Eggerthellaceae bacterium]